MISVPFIVVSMVLAVGVIVGLTIIVRAYVRHRGKSLVTCPETGRPAEVRVDALKAALDTAKGKPMRLQLEQCSRWPEREDCGQACLSQIENDVEGCHVWNIVQQWYRGRSCAYCQKPIEHVDWHDHQPALLGPDKKTIQWTDAPAEKLPEIFETHLPVCWSCHMAETFRREHPGEFVDRPWERGPMGEYTEEARDEGATPLIQK